MQELRGFSTRASITPTRFVNEYEWGNFKGDPARWMEKYFDAFFYYANWGSRDLMLRLPARVLDYAVARRYCCAHIALTRRKGEHVILEFHSEDEGADWSGDDGELSALLPLRGDLARGDRRCLYLAWLLCVQVGEVEENAQEPPVPNGLGALTESLGAFAEFLRIDGDLIAVAAEASPAEEGRAPRQEIERWIQSLPDDEKTKLLLNVALNGPNPQAELLAKFRESRNSGGQQQKNARTVAQLLKAAQERAAVRRREAKERAERDRLRGEQAARAAREGHLSDLFKRGEEAWIKVEELIAIKQPKKYDEAVVLLTDLRDLAARAGKAQECSARLRHIQRQHEAKPSLLRRLRKAGLLDSV
jgi:hypothetical protein